MENVAIKGRGGNDVQDKNWKGKILRIWITIVRHGGLGHEVQESRPYLSNATPGVAFDQERMSWIILSA